MNSLSIPADGFVGRGAELEAITESVERGDRLVTIVGPPGIGKTRLVREFLRRVARRQDCEWQRFCDLSEVRDARELPTSVARQLGMDAPTQKKWKDMGPVVGKALAARGRGVLVLDNVEQIVGETVQCVEEWLDAARDLVVLATSRERLRAAREVCFELGPLGLPSRGTDEESQAVTLFMDRARTHEPRFSPGSADIRYVAELVCTLDGIPLAIELAAARSGVMSLEELRNRVATGIDVLSRSTRSTPSGEAAVKLPEPVDIVTMPQPALSADRNSNSMG